MTINGSRYDLGDELRPFVAMSLRHRAEPVSARCDAGRNRKICRGPSEQKADVYNEQSLLRRDGGN